MSLQSWSTSLKTRLILVILAVVLPAGAASWFALQSHLELEHRVSLLMPRRSLPVKQGKVLGTTVEIEGAWDEGGFFRARTVEELPLSRRPKLRGTLQALDPEARTLRLYDRVIHADRIEEEQDPLADLNVGQRIEVSCSVDSEGLWRARKIEAQEVKRSNKIKGTITACTPRPEGGHDLEIHGLPIRLSERESIVSPGGPLHEIALASQMMRATHECLGMAQALLKERFRLGNSAPLGDFDEAPEDDAVAEVEQGLRSDLDSLHNLLKALRTADEDLHFASRLDELDVQLRVLEEPLATFLQQSRSRPEIAQELFTDTIEPHLRRRILDPIHSIVFDLEEELAAELRSITGRSRAAVRMTGIAMSVGLALALGLGLLFARSIFRPISDLESAARRIGAGDLSTHVDIQRRDELGVLADTFNHMTETLAASTVSVDHLNGVIDSMAGGLFLLGARGEIVSVNPAAAALLGYSQEELVGRPFREVCPPPGSRDEADRSESLMVREERELHRKSGGRLPVAFSGASLQDTDGDVRGYVCLLQDISERKRMELDLRRSVEEKELLLREVHHRVKNNLQVISSLLDLQSRSISDPVTLSKFQESQDRIRSLVLIHEQLYRARDREWIQLRAYLELLASHLSHSHLDHPDRIQIVVDVDDAVLLDLDRALACGLIVNELVTNALKHAFPGDSGGEIRIACRAVDGDRILLSVDDDGHGSSPMVEMGPESTLGRSLVEALTRQLGGTLVREHERGSSIRIEFPAPARAEVA